MTYEKNWKSEVLFPKNKVDCDDVVSGIATLIYIFVAAFLTISAVVVMAPVLLFFTLFFLFVFLFV